MKKQTPHALSDGIDAGEAIKKAVRERLLTEMLGGVKDSIGAGWKVLVMDEFTTKVMSSCCKMSDILDTGGRCKAAHAAVSAEARSVVMTSLLSLVSCMSGPCFSQAPSCMHHVRSK